jgi:hypothetical protein
MGMRQAKFVLVFSDGIKHRPQMRQHYIKRILRLCKVKFYERVRCHVLP